MIRREREQAAKLNTSNSFNIGTVDKRSEKAESLSSLPDKSNEKENFQEEKPKSSVLAYEEEPLKGKPSETIPILDAKKIAQPQSNNVPDLFALLNTANNEAQIPEKKVMETTVKVVAPVSQDAHKKSKSF